MITLTHEQRADLWIVSMIEDENSYSHGACQSWSATANLPENYAYISHEQMEEYYKQEDANGKPYKSAGHVDMVYDDCQDEDGNLIGKIVTSCTFSDEKYQAYRNSLPSEVPGIISGLVNSADSECASKIAEGYVPNSVSATFLNIDGEEVEEAPAFQYNEKNREALSEAVLKVTNGANKAKIQFSNDTRPVVMNREQILRLYLEMSQFVLQNEAYTTAFKAMVNAHKDDDRNQADYLSEHYVYGMELEPEYQVIFDNEMNEGMEDLMAMAEHWGINE